MSASKTVNCSVTPILIYILTSIFGLRKPHTSEDASFHMNTLAEDSAKKQATSKLALTPLQ